MPTIPGLIDWSLESNLVYLWKHSILLLILSASSANKLIKGTPQINKLRPTEPNNVRFGDNS